MTSAFARFGVLLSALAALALPSAAHASLESPPEGLRRTTLTLSDVLMRYSQALGAASHETRFEQWHVSEGGLSGTYVERTEGLEYADRLELGPFVTMTGRHQGQGWSQDENGLTVLRQDIHQRTTISERAVEYALDHPEAPGQGIELLGESSAPVDAFVVQIHPSGGRLVWLFFDAGSGLIDREESVVAERRVVTTYDDFRRVGDTTQAWHHHVSDGSPNNDEDWTLISLRFDEPIAATEFEIPADRRALVEFPAGQTSVRLPARIVNGKVIVRLTVAGRGLDFLLDSGASDIVFDASVATSMHLQQYGRTTQEIAGRFDRSRAIIPEIRVGDLQMHDVVVSTIPFELASNPDTKVVGLLGFDFFKDAVVRVDYHAGRVDAYEPAHFSPPDGSYTLPVALDDGVPLVSAEIGGARGDHFILDTGSSFTILFSAFAADHPQAVRATGILGLGDAAREPVAGVGVGGLISLTPGVVKVMRFGGAEFDDVPVYVTRSSRALEREDEDGLIGAPTLQRFVVYFDYARGRVDLIAAT